MTDDKKERPSSSDELSKLFSQTPEMQEWKQFSGTVNASLDEDDTVPVQLNVPRQFIRMVEFLEQKRAGDALVPPVPVEKTLNQMMLNALHEDLHGLVTDPLSFPHYRDLWNRFCDAQGAPEHKMTEDEGDGPF